MPIAERTTTDGTDALLEVSDVTLCEQMHEGHQPALDTIIGRHQRLVYWSAYAVVGSHNDAEEITADAFLTLWNKRDRFVLAGQSLAPWLATTARMLGKNRLRSTRRHEARPLDTARERLRTGFEDDVALRIALDHAVAALSNIDQAIFRLCLDEGMTYEQAAAALGLTTSSVRNRLSRLRKSLQHTLRPTYTEGGR
jgi:RNA polymerase sigma factor (sigma-70 family)